MLILTPGTCSKQFTCSDKSHPEEKTNTLVMNRLPSLLGKVEYCLG